MTCKCGVMFAASVVIVSSLILLVASFNIDTKNYGLHRGQQDSMFGFSVATYGEPGNSWVLVGAPTAQGERSRILKGGAVFKCNTSRDDGCEEIDFHQERSERGKPIDDKNNQWFGATVSTAGAHGPVVACAPRYVWFTTHREERRDPVGTCYIGKDDFRSFSEYSPCRTSQYGYHRQGSCQAGFSSGISKDGRRLFVGAPGSWYWQGQMYSIDPSIKYPFTPGIFGEAFGFGTKGQVIQQSLDDRPSVMSTPEGPEKDDDSYMGYSMVVGDFNGERVQGIAVGMPKGGEMLEGKVLLYTWSLTNYLNITGYQLGSYFGYALATSDVDGDGRDDLIIGAPMHTERNPENNNKYEVGRVHVVYQGSDAKYSTKHILDGFNSNSRFGLSLSTLGDLNKDGYGDFAVGAPYDGPNKAGAVYIFQGAKGGVIKQYSQVIYAEDMQSSFGSLYPVSTFGFSIAGGLDLDGNDYPDLAIGAYLTNSAYFFRARPVVKVEATLKFLAENKQIFLDQKRCPKPGEPHISVTCMPIELCMRYTGAGTPSRIEMDLQYTLDVKNHYPTSSRMYMTKERGKIVNNTLTLYKDAPFNCQLRDKIYLKEQIEDKLTELEIQVKYSLSNAWVSQSQSAQRNPTATLLPIVDLSMPPVVNDSINIFKNCGPDNVCIPDLRLFAEKTVNQYLYEVGKPLVLAVRISNKAEDAYNTKFYLHLPDGISFNGVRNKFEVPQYKVSCTDSWNHSIIVCDIGNPFTQDSVVQFDVMVEPLRNQKRLKSTYDFYMNVTSVNPENSTTLEDNSKTISVGILVDVTLSLEGKSTPANVFYNISHYEHVKEAKEDSDIGPPVIHSYTVTNGGPSDVEGLDIIIVWPVTTLGGEDLLYLLEPPHTSGDVTCEPIDAFENYKAYALTIQKNVWETIGVNKGTPTDKPGIGIEIGTDKPTGVTGNTVTRSITVVTFYGRNDEILEQKPVTGEPGTREYWGNISTITNQLDGPLRASGNISKEIIKYDKYQQIISRQIINKPVGNEELRYTSFQINSDVTTDVRYYDSHTGILLYNETINDQPSSKYVIDRIASTKQRLNKDLNTLTNTTKHLKFIGNDGTVFYHQIFVQTGTDTQTNTTTSTETTATVVTFNDLSGRFLGQEIVEGSPTSDEYWKILNKLISRYPQSVSVQANITKTIIHFVGNKEYSREPSSHTQLPVTVHKDVSTKIKVISSHTGATLREITVHAPKGTTEYNIQFNNLIREFKQPVIIHTVTTYDIVYKSSDGREIRRGQFVEHDRETHTPGTIEDTRTITVTTVIVYDVNRNELQRVNVSHTPDSKDYWEQINTLINGYQQQVTFEVDTRTVVVYYVNGQPVRSEQIGAAPLTTLNAHTDVSTEIKVTELSGRVIFQDTIPGKRGSSTYNERLKYINSMFREPLKIYSKTTYTITYTRPDGGFVRSATIIEEHTETYTPTYNPHPTDSRTVTITTVTFFDRNGYKLQQVNITETPGSAEYWEQLNKLISGYQKEVTTEVTTRKIITYYVNGQPTKTEQVGGVTGQESYVSHTDIITEITVTSASTGKQLFTGSIPGKRGSEVYNDYFNNIVSRFREPTVITTKTTYTITYTRPSGGFIRSGTIIEHHTETYHPPSTAEDRRTAVLTTVTIYDRHRTILHQMNITDQPQSEAYWQHINAIISRYQQQEITIHVNTRTIVTYYVDGIAVRSEDVGSPTDPRDSSLVPHVDVVTLITVYNSNRHVLHTDTIPGQKDSSTYNNRINNIISRFREPITIVSKTTYTITYSSSGGGVIHRGTTTTEETNTYNHQQRETSVTRVLTTISFYGPTGGMLHQETIAEDPGSAIYWEKIKNVITRYNTPINIHTNTSKVITYYLNGVQTRDEHVGGNAGIYEAPFTSHVEIENVITYYDSDKNPFYQEKVTGELTKEDRSRRIADLSTRYGKSFTMETNTTKTITYRTSSGHQLHTDAILVPFGPGSADHLTRTTTQTTFKVYEGQRLVHEETIQGEPGSTAYNNVIASIISRFHGAITIRTNSTKTITFYNADGLTLDTQHRPEPQSTIQRGSSSGRTDASTTITFYGPDGRTIHQDSFSGAPGQDLYKQLNDIASRYGGVVKSYGGQLNEDGSIGGPITLVDSPYPGGRPTTSDHHFINEFGTPHGQHSSSSQGTQFQDLNQNQLNLESFAKGKGFRSGVFESEPVNSRSNYESPSYDGSHNHLSHYQGQQDHGTGRRVDPNRGAYNRRKREVDNTDAAIEALTNCATSTCIQIRCATGHLQRGKEVHIAIRSRVNVDTLKNISRTQPINIQSMVLARVREVENLSGSPADRTLYRHQITTSVMAPQPDIKIDIIPLWVVILSAVAGTLILLLLIFLLHKCGFFKRNRPSDAPERQPLNRNGHFQHGDEAL